MDLKLVVGLEIHLHLKLESKMFCRCSARVYDAKPNSHTCPTCLGLPGALPVVNEKAVKFTQMLGLALNCKLNTKSKFDRKNYFYPDLPKGYQISQYDEPLCQKGHFRIDGKDIEITRVHLEEDTGKSFHEGSETLLDFNKSGLALVEIVTEPVFRSAEEAVEFSKTIQKIARTLRISDADMEKGQFRLEANISMRNSGDEKLPDYKVEVKNINSFKFLEKAINYEKARQSAMLAKGEKPVQENRGWDDIKLVTLSQRTKEEAHDYRYFPEPDIPPMEFSTKYLDDLKKLIPEFLYQKVDRFVQTFNLSRSAAQILCESDELSKKFEEASKKADAKTVANLLVNKLEIRSLDVGKIVELANNSKKYSLNDTKLIKIIQKVIKDNNKAYHEFINGKDEAMKFLIGKVMAATKRAADPVKIIEILKKVKGGTIV